MICSWLCSWCKINPVQCRVKQCEDNLLCSLQGYFVFINKAICCKEWIQANPYLSQWFDHLIFGGKTEVLVIILKQFTLCLCFECFEQHVFCVCLCWGFCIGVYHCAATPVLTVMNTHTKTLTHKTDRQANELPLFPNYTLFLYQWIII